MMRWLTCSMNICHHPTLISMPNSRQELHLFSQLKPPIQQLIWLQWIVMSLFTMEKSYRACVWCQIYDNGSLRIFSCFCCFLLALVTRTTVKYSWRTSYPECSDSTLGAKRWSWTGLREYMDPRRGGDLGRSCMWRFFNSLFGLH